MSVTLARTVRRGVSSGTPLPDPYQVLRMNKIRFRRANLHMVAGLTGSMKTLWLLDIVTRMRVPTFYQCNDSDQATIASRLLARSVQRPVDEVARDMQGDPDWAASILNSYDFVRWSFDPAPTLDDISLEMEAFTEIHGEYPYLFVLDILKNVSYYEESDHGSVGGRLQYLHALGRSTEAAVIAVHHCTEGSRAYLCPSRSDILQKQNELPVLQLTVAVRGESFYVAAVKNRYGPQDPSGNTAHRLRVDPNTCQFWES